MKEYLIGEGGLPTFEEAFAAAKRDAGEREEIVFRVRGTVALTSPVSIACDDLFNGRKIRFAGENNATVTGGGIVTGFEHFRDNVYRARVPEIAYTRSLYIDGKTALRPRTEEHRAAAWDQASGECEFYREGDRVTGLVTTDREILTWKNIRDVEMIFNVGWTHHIIPIESVRELNDGRAFIQPLRVPFEVSQRPQGVEIGGCPTFFENVFERLGTPGEWYFDRTERTLYLALDEGDRPENHTVEIPATDALFSIAGTPEREVENVEFCDLTFRNTSFLRPSLYGHSDLQAGFAREDSDAEMPKRGKPYELDTLKLPGALRLLAAKNVNFNRCAFTCLDTTALTFEYGARDCLVTDCDFFELGAGALMIGDVCSDRSHHPDDPRETVRGITLENNTIRDTGKDFFSTAAILVGYAAECNILHNDIHHVPYTAVSVGWGWGHVDVSVGPYRPTPWMIPSVSAGHRICQNHIHHCMMTLYDGGAIYTLGAMEGTVISGNYIHEPGGYDGEGCGAPATRGYNVAGSGWPDGSEYAGKGPFPGGIYLDEGSRGIEVSDNVLWGVTTPLFYHNQIDEGYRRVVFRDNVLNRRPGDSRFPAEIADAAGRAKP